MQASGREGHDCHPGKVVGESEKAAANEYGFRKQKLDIIETYALVSSVPEDTLRTPTLAKPGLQLLSQGSPQES